MSSADKTWTGARIVQLRRRLGWSRAELSARLAVTTVVLETWEKGEAWADADSANHLLYLQALIDVHADKVHQQPVAEMILSRRNLNQINRVELLSEDENSLKK